MTAVGKLVFSAPLGALKYFDRDWVPPATRVPTMWAQVGAPLGDHVCDGLSQPAEPGGNPLPQQFKGVNVNPF